MVSIKKIFKKAVPKLIPDPTKTGAVVRALSSAHENKLAPDMLPVVLASFGYSDEVLLNLQRLYQQFVIP